MQVAAEFNRCHRAMQEFYYILRPLIFLTTIFCVASTASVVGPHKAAGEWQVASGESSVARGRCIGYALA
jgi:hypothetical protein